MNLKKQLLDKAKWVAKDYMLDRELPRRYAKAAAATQVDPKKVLLVKEKLDTLPATFSILKPYLEQRYDMQVTFLGLGKEITSRMEYHRRCQHLVDEMASAAYVFLDDGSDVISCVDLRSETKVVQLWHACGAFKKWGMSTADKQFGNTAEKLRQHPFYGNLSLVPVSAPEVAWAYREAMMLEDTPDVVQPLGVSRTDAFFNHDFAQSSEEWLHAAYPQTQNRKVILYAPTFRGTTRNAQAPDQLDIAAMKQQLGDDFALVVRHHPLAKDVKPIPPELADFACLSSADDPIDALLTTADMLVTDYSSVIFEYALLQRPMLFFAYDLADYDDWRGFYYDFEEMTPGPIVADTEALIEHIKQATASFDPTEVTAFRDKFMSACDGHATERICEYVIGR